MSIKDVIDQAEKEFDEKTTLENYQGNFKSLQENSLFDDESFPESNYELSADRIKVFIRSYTKDLLDKFEKEKHEYGLDQYAMGQREGEQYGRWKAKQDLLLSVVEMINRKAKLNDTSVKAMAYNQALSEIIKELK